MSVNAFLDDLRRELGPGFAVEAVDDGERGLLEIKARVELYAAVFVDKIAVSNSYASMAHHLAHGMKYEVRNAVEKVGLPDQPGFVKVPVKSWHELRYLVASDPERYAMYSYLFDDIR